MTDVVNVGSTDNDGNGDTLRAAFSQINTRFNELLSTIDGGDAWATGVTYTATPIRQWVIESGQAYVAAVNHVSGASFAADLAAGKWFAVDSAQILADLAAPTGASLIGYTPTGLLTATTVEGALNEVRDASKVSYTPAGTGAVATNVQNKLRESVSVKDFGASPSASASVNAAAINAALATGKSVYLPDGTYDIDDTLMPVGNQTLFGESQLGTVIRQTVTNKNAITISSAAGVFVRDIKLTSVASSTSNGIYITASNPTYIQNVRVEGFYRGICGKSCNNIFLTQPYVINCLLDGMDFEDCIDVYLNNIYSGGHVNGAALAFTANSDGLYVNGAQLVVSKYNFIARKAGGGSTFPGHAFINQMICDSAVANGSGIYLDFCNSFLFNNCWSSNQGGGAGKNFYIGPGASDTQVIGGKFFNCTGNGIDVQGIGAVITGASVEDASVGSPNTYDGIRLVNAKKTTISNVRCYTNTATQRKGISVSVGCTDTHIINCDLDDNVSGDYECSELTTNNTYQKQYQNAAVTIANTATATLYTFPAEKQGTYLFFAGQADNANGGIRAMAYVRVGSSSLALTSLASAGGIALSASGLDVQATNTAGGDLTVDYSFIRL